MLKVVALGFSTCRCKVLATLEEAPACTTSIKLILSGEVGKIARDQNLKLDRQEWAVAKKMLCKNQSELGGQKEIQEMPSPRMAEGVSFPSTENVTMPRWKNVISEPSRAEEPKEVKIQS